MRLCIGIHPGGVAEIRGATVVNARPLRPFQGRSKSVLILPAVFADSTAGYFLRPFQGQDRGHSRLCTALPSFKVGWAESSSPTITARIYGGTRGLGPPYNSPIL